MTANSAMSSQTMPTLFVPHGAGPCFFMEWNPRHAWDAMADFLKGIAATLPAKPTPSLWFPATGCSRPSA